MAELTVPIKIDGFKCVEDMAQAVLSWTYKGKTLKEWADSISEPKTNADRIRSMTDEELAEFLFSFDECDTTIGSGYSTTYYSQHFCTAPCGGDDTSECLHCITEWLKQEVEE